MPPGLSFLKNVAYVAIVGSRDYPIPELLRVRKLVDMLNPGAMVVTGGAFGVDTTAERDARASGRGCTVVRPSVSGRQSLMDRNTVIVRASDAVVAFWDGKSPGTADTIAKAINIHGRCVVALPGHKPEVWCR